MRNKYLYYVHNFKIEKIKVTKEDANNYHFVYDFLEDKVTKTTVDNKDSAYYSSRHRANKYVVRCFRKEINKYKNEIDELRRQNAKLKKRIVDLVTIERSKSWKDN